MKTKIALNNKTIKFPDYPLLEKNSNRTNINVLYAKKTKWAKTKIVLKKITIAIHILDYG